MRILHRYIFRELLKAFGLALAAVTGVVCLGMVLNALQDEGIGPLASLAYMALSVPGAMYIALGLSAVLAATLAYGRLAADNEVMACRASGVPVWNLFWPAVLLAIVASATNLFLAIWPLPASSYAVKRISLADAERLFFTRLASTGKFKLKKIGFEMTVDRVVGDMLYGPTIKYREHDRQFYCYAPYGRPEFDRAGRSVSLFLSDAQVVEENGRAENRGTHRVSARLPTEIPREIKEQPIWGLMAAQSRPENFSEVLKDLKEGEASDEAIQREKNKVRAEAMAEMHSRLAAAVGCFGLVVLGAALGALFHSGHLLTAFGVALAPGLGAMFFTMAAKKAVAGHFDHPEDALYLIWTPNILLLMLAAGAMAHLVWAWASPVRLRDRLQSLTGGRPA